jgi:hypothetical protein
MVIFQSILLGLTALIIASNAYGQALSEFCFQSPSKARQGIGYANQILLNNEKFIHEPGQNCAQIYLKQDRFELVDMFIRRKFQLQKSSGSMLQVHRTKSGRQHCRLEISEVGNSNENQNQFKVGKQTKIRSYGAKISNRYQTTVVTISGQPSEVMTPEGKIKIECSIGNTGAATIKIFMQSKLSSQLLAMPGQTLQIGSIGKQDNSNQRSVGIKSGVSLNKNKQNSTKTYQIKYTSF